MTAATRTRGHLRPVPDLDKPTPANTAAPRPVYTAGLTRRQAQIAEHFDAGRESACEAEAVNDMEALIARFNERMAEPNPNLNVLLRDYFRTAFALGYVEKATSLEADIVLAEIHSLDAYRHGGDDAS